MPDSLSGWLGYLEQLHPKTIALGLARVSEVRARLGLEPDFPLITVAGTNGKGSSCAMLERIYLEAGYRVACYTSPHLLRYNERVRVNGIDAGDDALCRAFAAVEAARGDTPLTYFEFGTLAAMWHFMAEEVELAILEVGLGGRLDAVNIFEPACALVTSVDLDHMDYLGNSRDAIAYEKAGIYRAGLPALCGDPDPPSTLLNHAREIHADYRQLGQQFIFTARGERWDFQSREFALSGLPLPALQGAFQLNNAATVLEAVHCLRELLPVPEPSIRAGLQHVRLAGRFQEVGTRPRVILDVAHNPHAAVALADNLRRTRVSGKTVAVCAMLADKDIAGVMRAMHAVIDLWMIAGIDEARGADAATLHACLQQVAPVVAVQRCDDPVSAFRQACQEVGENDRIVVFGSFYTVADVMREISSMGEAWQTIR